MKGIKGTLIRGTQKIKQKMGKTDKTVDDEYEMTHSRTVSTEKQAQNFSKHVNQLIENYHAMSTTLSFLAEDIRDLYQTNDPNCKQRQMADQLTKMIERIEQGAVLKFVSFHLFSNFFWEGDLRAFLIPIAFYDGGKNGELTSFF